MIHDCLYDVSMAATKGTNLAANWCSKGIQLGVLPRMALARLFVSYTSTVYVRNVRSNSSALVLERTILS